MEQTQEERRIGQLERLRAMKRLKLQQQQAQELQAALQVGPCARCGRMGHRDARSRQCPHNSHYGQPTAAEQAALRRAGIMELEEATANPNAPPCPHCIDGTCGCLPHSRSSSRLCHAHRLNTKEVCDSLLGPAHVQRTVKATLQGALHLNGPNRRQRHLAKGRVIAQIRHVVDTMQAVALRATQFVHFLILRQLDDDAALPIHERQGLPSYMLTQRYMYGPLQLVTGNTITSTNPLVPPGQDAAFQEFQEAMGDTMINAVGMSPALAYLALDLATAFRNSIAMTFKTRALQYLAFRVRQALPRDQWPRVKTLSKMCQWAYQALTNTMAGDAVPMAMPQAVIDAFAQVQQEGGLGPSSAARPIDQTRLNAEGTVYLAHMHAWLRQMEQHNAEADVINGEAQMVTEVDGGWVAQHLRDIDEVATLSRRRLSRLRFHVKNQINNPNLAVTFGNGIPQPLQDQLAALVHQARGQIERSALYMAGRILIDPASCMWSTTVRRVATVKLFSLFPTTRWTKRFIAVPANLLGVILAGADVVHTPHSDHRDEPSHVQMQADADVFQSAFNFRKVKLFQAANAYHHFHHLNPGPVPGLKKVFLNIIHTDGHQVAFHYAQRTSEDKGLPALTIEDFQDEQGIDIIGADPGHTHLFTAIDGYYPTQTRMRLSNREWISKSGFFIRRRQQLAARAADDIDPLLNSLPDQRTTSPVAWLNYCHAAQQVQPQLVAHFGYNYVNWRFLAYNGSQKMQAEAVNIFLGCSRKYPHHARRQQLPVIAYGAGTFGSMPGKNPKRSVLPALKRAEAEGHLCVVMIDEAYTSQVCPLCQERSLQAKHALSSVSGTMEALWGAKECTICHTNWNRDHAASRNILELAQTLRQGNPRPAIFTYTPSA